MAGYNQPFSTDQRGGRGSSTEGTRITVSPFCFLHLTVAVIVGTQAVKQVDGTHESSSSYLSMFLLFMAPPFLWKPAGRASSSSAAWHVWQFTLNILQSADPEEREKTPTVDICGEQPTDICESMCAFITSLRGRVSIFL